MTTLAYNIELQFANVDDFNHWHNTLLVSRQAYNACADYITKNNVPLNLQKVHEAVYGWMRTNFPSLPAQGVIRIYKDVISTLRSIRKNKHKNAKLPKRKNLAMRIDKRLYANLNSEGISLTGAIRNKRTRVCFKLYEKVKKLFSKYETSDPLLFERDGRLFISIPFIVPEIPTTNNDVIGIDLGIKRFITTSDGNVFIDREFNARKRKLRYLKRCLRTKGTDSAKRHLKKIRHKERHTNKEQTYKAVNTLIASTSASIIVIEDLKKIKAKTSRYNNGFKRKRHNNMISQVPFYKFREILTYKATLVGKQVESVSPRYTSQTDCRTCKRDWIRKGCRYICNDGIVLDADWNAAINIANRFFKHPLTSIPFDGGVKPLSGRVSVNHPNVEIHVGA